MASSKGSISRTCLHCGKSFTTWPYKLRVGRGKYCQSSCAMAAKGGCITRICRHCEVPFVIPQSRISQGRGVYCGKACQEAHRPSMLERFWKFVDKKDEDSCWPWTGYIEYRRGVPINANFRDGKGIYQESSRMSWEIHNGPIPDGLWVLHHCDFRICVNPKHLFLGTNSDNIADKVSKGRHTKRLTDAQAIGVFEAAKHESQSVVAKRFGISQSLVSVIVIGKQRKHLHLTRSDHIA